MEKQDNVWRCGDGTSEEKDNILIIDDHSLSIFHVTKPNGPAFVARVKHDDTILAQSKPFYGKDNKAFDKAVKRGKKLFVKKFNNVNA